MKPGWQTTEFWVTIVAKLIGLLMVLGVIGSDSVDRLMGMIGIIVAAFGYTVSRGVVKSAGVDAPPDTKPLADLLGQVFDAAKPRTTPPPGVNLLLVLCCTAPLLLLGGCADDPALQQVITARQAYTHTLDTLTTARELGKIDDAWAQRIETWRATAAAELDAADAAARAGRDLDARYAIERFQQALDRLIEAQTQATQRKESHGPGGNSADFERRDRGRGLCRAARAAHAPGKPAAYARRTGRTVFAA